MQPSLRLGLAGLGTVGASVVRLIDRHGTELAVRCGRPIVLRAVSARDRTPRNSAWFPSSVQSFGAGVAVAQSLNGVARNASQPVSEAVTAVA